MCNLFFLFENSFRFDASVFDLQENLRRIIYNETQLETVISHFILYKIAKQKSFYTFRKL